jgi:hypothetical protein
MPVAAGCLEHRKEWVTLMFFDTERKARELGIRDQVYEKLKKEVKHEFLNDEMMFELHLLRALMEYSRKKTGN